MRKILLLMMDAMMYFLVFRLCIHVPVALIHFRLMGIFRHTMGVYNQGKIANIF
ncbi:hypothetical protein [Photorhabdus stackebrandtii]|uniref:hypothetical protein n=1 Tax=Photorhabdus stackebrandtii TaxID=1123042 RepID=UPI001407334C|nr:hypothetical protein [Photorhabdus stackebrandtii]